LVIFKWGLSESIEAPDIQQVRRSGQLTKTLTFNTISQPLAMPSYSRSSSSILGDVVEICIVSPDIYSTIDGFMRVGVGPFQVFDFNSSTVAGQELYGQKGSNLFQLQVAFAKQNSVVIEIMQPTGGKSLMQTYLDENGGRQGVQHVAWNMGGESSMEDRQKLMAKKGFVPVMQGIWKGRRGECHFCFFDTKEKGIGTVFETIKFSKDWEDPPFEWYPSTPDEGSGTTEGE
jgi:hypothetical protein